jgi:hypothetical protein
MEVKQYGAKITSICFNSLMKAIWNYLYNTFSWG